MLNTDALREREMEQRLTLIRLHTLQELLDKGEAHPAYVERRRREELDAWKAKRDAWDGADERELDALFGEVRQAQGESR